MFHKGEKNMKEIFDITRNAEISADKFEEFYFSAIDSADTKEEKIKIIIDRLLKNTPSSIDYMFRIVTRLADDEFKNDEGQLKYSTRVTIVKQFLNNTKHIKKLTYDIKKNEKLQNKDLKIQYNLKPLIRFITGEESIRDDNIVQLQEIAKNTIDESTFDRLQEFEISKINNKIAEKNKKKIIDNIIKAEYERYVSNGKALTEEKCNKIKENIIKQLPDSPEIILSKKEINKIKKDVRDQLYDNYFILQLADDLANSKFRSNNKTNQYLYWFAIAFNMTFGIENEKTDIEKNLFEDYYNFSFHNYIKYTPNERKYIAEPTGAGINFKNFTEVIYLYYINKKLSPEEKLSKSLNMIRDCIESYYTNKENHYNPQAFDLTYMFEDDFYDHINDKEDDFKSYLLNNYVISDTDINSIENVQRTASQYLKLIISKISDVNNTIVDDFECVLDSFFRDSNSINLQLFSKETLLDVLSKINDYINFDKTIVDEDNVSRQSIIAAYFHMFLSNISDEDKSRIDSYKCLFDTFSYADSVGTDESLDEILEECRYQPLSYKNFYDCVMVFLLYLEIFPL